MLKKNAFRRIMVSSLALVIVSILYFFPSNENTNIIKTVNYIDTNITPIYLLNKANYVVRTNIQIDSKDTLKKAKELIESLAIDSNKSEYIANGLKPIIPKNTKVIDISLDKKLLKINFSKELLNVNKDSEEKLIESLIYTLTEMKEIEEIMIFVEGTKLNVLPQTKINLPNTLNRDFGINKIYDITNIKDVTKTTIYYVGKNEDVLYYIPITKMNNNKKEILKQIIEELKSSPIYETNLISYLASSTELLNYETLENQIYLSFNNEILSSLEEESILEEVKYSISLSLKDLFQYHFTLILNIWYYNYCKFRMMTYAELYGNI